MRQVQLSKNWQCKKRNPSVPLVEDNTSQDGWFAASVPGVVQQALVATHQIPDPFYGVNETLVQWVGESDWLYRCSFERPASFTGNESVMLCFDGLDTFATVWLNGQSILTSDNMFLSHRIDVGSQLQSGENTLLILFESALQRGREREATYGKQTVWNGDASRVYVRKAQYHYGWDWGPTLLTSGPWKPVRLEVYTARIADLYCPTDISPELDVAYLHVNATCDINDRLSQREVSLHLAVYNPAQEKIVEQKLPCTGEAIQHTFELRNPQLWWPRSYGEQPLYRVVATLRYQNDELDRKEQRIGLRRLQLVQQPLTDGEGTTFYFEVNNTPIFCGGANWIPADSFLPSLTPERYRAWLQLAAGAHMTMLRVWGGGIYEDDAFYDSCDELGLLVWQDVLFACGIYPALDWFQKSIQAEVEAAILRLRHHPSLVLWCGNNEDYSIAQSLGVYDSSFTGDFTATPFPARALYEQLLPQICARLDPQRPYWPGSPYGGSDVSDERRGDVHEWRIWHNSVPYQNYARTKARFVSEFGMESFPVLKTIANFTPLEERYPQSRTLDHHNKSEGGSRILAGYLVENIRMPTDLPAYIYATQFIQSEAMGAAIRGWRRYWGHPNEQTGGALLWQLNDCWPVTSWSIVDYAFRPKAAYYTVRRELAPLTVGLARTTKDSVELWAVNGTTSPISATIETSTWTLDGTLIAKQLHDVTLAANQGTELGHILSTNEQIVSARLQREGVTIARATLWPEPFKYLTLPDPQLGIERLDAHTLRVQAKRPVKGVWLSANEGVEWSDNMLDVMPGDPHIIKVQELEANEIRVQWLSDEYANITIPL